MKAGVLGFAHGHADIYCRQWQKRPELGIELVAGWDQDPERLHRAVKEHGIHGCNSIEELLETDQLEAVVIASETAWHADHVEAAARAGKAIILQKPIALTLAEADRIQAAVEKYRVPFTLAWQMRVDPQNLRIRQLLQENTLGRVFSIRRRHTLGLLLTNPAFKKSWHVNPALNRDIWSDDAAHPMDFIYWLFGRPESITAELFTAWDPEMPNDNGVALFRYSNGMLAEVSCSFVSVAGENTTEIVAENGVLVQNYGDAPSTAAKPERAVCLKYFLREENRWTNDPDPGVAAQGERIALLSEPLAQFLHGRRAPLATAQEGKDVLQMIFASYESARTGRRIQIHW